MKKKNILIISRSFYPRQSPRSYRTTELVKEFARQGNEVTLLTPKDDEQHVPFEEEFGVTIEDLGPLKLPEIEMNKSNRFIYLAQRILRRALKLFFEYPDIELMYRVKQSLKRERDYDLMISIAVPHPIHWGVAWARTKHHPVAASWVADCGDPYMGAKLDSFNKLFYFKYFEKWFCKKADVITVPIESAKEGYYPEFRDKIEVIPQGFDFEEVDVSHSASQNNDVPTFGYAGSLIPGGRDPRLLLDYLLEQDKEFKFILYTRTTGMIEPYLEKAEGRIEIRDYIPRKKLLNKLAGMDFLVNFENASSLMMPSKLIDYYLTGRPVLSVSGTELDRGSVDEFLEGNYEQKYDFKNMDRYRIENVCKRFLELTKDSK